MKIICGIYKITSPENKNYIGQSTHILQRLNFYYRLSGYNGKSHIVQSLEKYGWVKHSFEIIEECKKGLLNKREKYYIKKFQSHSSENGLNSTWGGSGQRIKLILKKRHHKTIKDFAKLCNVSVTTIGRKIKSGVIKIKHEKRIGCVTYFAIIDIQKYPIIVRKKNIKFYQKNK